MLESLTGPHQPLVRWRSRLAEAIAERRAAHVAASARIAARLFVEKPNTLPPAPRRAMRRTGD